MHNSLSSKIFLVCNMRVPVRTLSRRLLANRLYSAAANSFVIRHSDLFRHSGFVIRHFIGIAPWQGSKGWVGYHGAFLDATVAFFHQFWPHFAAAAVFAIELAAALHAILNKRDARPSAGWA